MVLHIIRADILREEKKSIKIYLSFSFSDQSRTKQLFCFLTNTEGVNHTTYHWWRQTLNF